MKKLKIYFFGLILLEMLFSFAPVLAAESVPDYSQGGTNPISKQIEKYLCAPTDASKTGEIVSELTGNNVANPGGNPAGSDLYNCVNKLYKFAIIFGSVIAMFFIVIAGYVYMSAEGNSESVEKAKSIFVSSITGLVLLFSVYVLLRYINPDLIKFNSFQPYDIRYTGVDLPPGGVISPASNTSAQQLLNLHGKKITLSNSGSCPGNSPMTNIRAIAEAKMAIKDGPGSACNQGTTSIEPGVLGSLVSIANANLPITVTSLTSGHHASANDPHYAGLAVDLVPANLQQNGQAILNALIQGGATKVAVECNLSGKSQYILIYLKNGGLTSVDASKCTGQPNYHWHAQWSGSF